MKKFIALCLAALCMTTLPSVANATEAGTTQDDELPPAWLGIDMSQFEADTQPDGEAPPLTYPTQDVPVEEPPAEVPPVEVSAPSPEQEPTPTQPAEPTLPPAEDSPSSTSEPTQASEEDMPPDDVDPSHDPSLSEFDPTEWVPSVTITPEDDTTESQQPNGSKPIIFNQNGGITGEVYSSPQVTRKSDVTAPAALEVQEKLVDEAAALRQYNREVIQGIRSGVVSTTAPQKTYNVRDILGIIAVVFIAAAIVVLWIMSYIRSRKDPMRKWLK